MFSKGLTVRDIDNLLADVFVMSPPCQPFTRYMYFCLDNYVLPWLCLFYLKKHVTYTSHGFQCSESTRMLTAIHTLFHCICYFNCLMHASFYFTFSLASLGWSGWRSTIQDFLHHGSAGITVAHWTLCDTILKMSGHFHIVIGQDDWTSTSWVICFEVLTANK